jgi:hypothetical protein
VPPLKPILSTTKQTKVLGKPKEIGLPPRDRWGEVVPKTGTHCVNCEYFEGQMTCSEPNFIAWNGSNKIPASTPETYCSIWWSIKKEKQA